MTSLEPGSLDPAAYRDGGARRRLIRSRSYFLAFMVFLAVFTALLMTDRSVGADWGRAFGTDQPVTGTVVRIFPSVGVNRTCTLDRVALAWQAGSVLQIGYFDVCSDEDRDYPVGSTVHGWSPVPDAHHDLVAVSLDSRAGAIFGFVLEMALVLGILLVLLGFVRSIVRLVRAPKLIGRGPQERRTVYDTARTFPNRRRIRNLGYRVIFATPGDGALDRIGDWALIADRKADRMPETGDTLTVVPTGRTVFRRKPTGPVALVRDRDRWVFWALALRRPKPSGR
jgi:hypothetical protein